MRCIVAHSDRFLIFGRCGASYPCEAMHAQCATGAAGGIVDPAYTYFCAPDLPKGAIPNGAGACPIELNRLSFIFETKVLGPGVDIA